MARNDDIFNSMVNVPDRNKGRPISPVQRQQDEMYTPPGQAAPYGQVDPTGTTQGGWSQGPTYDEWYADNYNADLTQWDVGGSLDDYWQESYVDYMYENFGDPNDETLVGGY
jgi:hypothetical protein